jgi:hypothetical protein
MAVKRLCKDCGGSCFGFRCRSCYRKGKNNSISRTRGVRAYHKRKSSEVE